MIQVFRSKTKRLLFWFPFIVTLHNNNTSVLYNFGKSFLICKLFDPSIDYHIKVSFLSPLQKGKFSLLPLFLWLFFIFTTILFDGLINFIFKAYFVFLFLFLLIFRLLPINLAVSDCWNVCCRAYIKRRSMELLVESSCCSSNS